jgi:hypothetical protein
MGKRTKRKVIQGDIQIAREVGYIIGKAEAHDARVVRFGPLVLFSTHSGDAWVLDPADGLALCVARDGEKQDYSILETKTKFEIGWNAKYQLDGGLFIVRTADGNSRSVLGYPVSEIRNA